MVPPEKCAPPTPYTKNMNTDTQAHLPSSELTAEIFARTIAMSRLPTPEPQVFTGDPLQYPDWISSFTTLIGSRGIPQGEKIHYLKRYLGGQAREAVSGFFLLQSQNAFEEAKCVLEKRFGNPFVIAEAFRSKLDLWQKIQTRDKTGLRRYADLLQQCVVAATEIRELHILDDMRENRRLVSKLPELLGHRWNRLIARNKRERGCYPLFRDFATFVMEESEILNDPVVVFEPKQFNAMEPDGNHTYRKSNNYSRSQPSKRSLATTVQTVDKSNECIFCDKGNHTVQDCRNFSRRTIDERRDFIMKKGLCFSCFEESHMSRQCINRCECKVCHKKHPTSLHYRDKYSKSGNKTSETHEIEQREATCHKVLSGNKESVSSMVVPVWVLCKENPGSEMLVYALLDTMSDVTFILDQTGEDLQAHSSPAKLRLSTMTSKGDLVESHKYENLVVRGFNSTSRIPLPTTYSRDHIPLDRSHIATPETAREWSYLHRIADLLTPKQDCPVGLLIGYNCPSALAPQNCVLGTGNQPYGVETKLGWNIVGGS
ncbi:uncharacterized protein LOC144353261 [Saccoglossus kowalevskii]